MISAVECKNGIRFDLDILVLSLSKKLTGLKLSISMKLINSLVNLLVRINRDFPF